MTNGVLSTSYVRVNDWFSVRRGVGGFIATYRCEVIGDQPVRDFLVDFNYTGSGVPVRGWTQRYPGRIERGFIGRDGGYALRNGGNEFSTPSLNPGDSFLVRLHVNRAGFDENDFEVDCNGLAEPNQPPIADAGSDLIVEVGATVTLDGSSSSDTDGDPLTYSWQLVAKPVASAALLDDPSKVGPTFVADVAGSYKFDLTVNDGKVDSVSDRVIVSSELINRAPVADAGDAQTVQVGSTVTLDGGGSTDEDGDSLTFSWRIAEAPPQSSAVLSSTDTLNTTLVPDSVGDYRIELIVNDGTLDSAPSEVLISTFNSAPVADAGADQQAFVGDTVILDGSASTDGDGDALQYTWTLTARPDQSTASLSDTAAIQPQFVADVAGQYVLQLIVDDGFDSSAADLVVINVETPNSRPVANAGADQSATVGSTLVLDGSASTDADGDDLDYQWSVLSRPADSASSPQPSNGLTSTLLIDRPGDYLVQLIVSDGVLASEPDTIMISTVNSAPVAVVNADASPAVGDQIDLDGSASSDPDGDELSYDWSLLSQPQGSVATLANTDQSTNSLTLDSPGDYVVQLIVSDAVSSSEPETLLISTVNSQPVASAQSAGELTVGAQILLNGSGSTDPDGDPLQYTWRLLTSPADSEPTLEDDALQTATLLVDVAGDYAVELVVNDGQLSSAPFVLNLSVGKPAPLLTSDISVLVELGQSVEFELVSDAVDNPEIAFSIVDQPEHGSVTLTEATITYQASAETIGLDSFTYVAANGATESNTSTVFIDILPARLPLQSADIDYGLLPGTNLFYVNVPPTRIPAGSTVTVTNVASGQSVTLELDEFESLTAQLPASAGDEIQIYVGGTLEHTLRVAPLVAEEQSPRSAYPPLPELIVTPVPFVPSDRAQWVTDTSKQIYEVTFATTTDSGYLGVEYAATELYAAIGETPAAGLERQVQYLQPIYVSEGDTLHVVSRWIGEGETGLSAELASEIGILADGRPVSDFLITRQIPIAIGEHDITWSEDAGVEDGALELSTDEQVVGLRFANPNVQGQLLGSWLSLQPVTTSGPFTSFADIFLANGGNSLDAVFDGSSGTEPEWQALSRFDRADDSAWYGPNWIETIGPAFEGNASAVDIYLHRDTQSFTVDSFEALGADAQALPRLHLIYFDEPQTQAAARGFLTRFFRRFSFFREIFRTVPPDSGSALPPDQQGLTSNPDSLLETLGGETVTTLSNGDIRVAVGSEGLTRTLKLSPPHDPAPPQTVVYGELAGNVSVDNSGGLNYEMPLVMPDAPGGLVPSMQIGYNSNAGLFNSGVLGVGWSISGIPAITRCAKSYAKDGAYQPLDFVRDSFCLGDQRLLFVPGSNEVVYQLENDPATRIYLTGTQLTGYQWTMLDRSGMRYEFGRVVGNESRDGLIKLVDSSGDADGRAYFWSLNSVNNSLNQKYEIEYFDNAEANARTTHYVVEKISYGTVAGSEVTVRFEYNDHNLIHPGNRKERFLAGYRFSSHRYLKSVKIYRGDSLYSGYYFDYLVDPEMAEWRLARARFCNTTACYPEKRFSWKPRASQTQATGVVTMGFQPEQNVATDFKDNVTGDFNGDGRPDVAVMTRQGADNDPSADFSICLYESASRLQGNFDCSLYTLFEPDASNVPSEEPIYRPLVSDFNGDGLSDLLFPEETPNSEWRICYARASAQDSTQLDFDCRDVSYSPQSDGKLQNFYRANTVGDFNGDGIGDVFNQYRLRMCLGTSEGQFECGVSRFSSNQGETITGFSHDVRIADFTGDGVSDLLFDQQSRRSGVTYVGTNTTFKDWMCRRSDIAYATPGLEPVASSASSLFGNYTCQQVSSRGSIIGDFNGDGLSDLIAYANDSGSFNNRIDGREFGRWFVYYSDGKKFLPRAVRYGYKRDVGSTRDVLVGDFNGDGLSDLAGRASGTTWYINYSTPNGFIPVTRTISNIDLSAAVALDYDGDGRTDIAGLPGLRSRECEVVGGYYETQRVSAWIRDDRFNGGFYLGYEDRNVWVSQSRCSYPNYFVSYLQAWGRPQLSTVRRFRGTEDEVGERVYTVEYQYNDYTGEINAGYPERSTSGGEYVAYRVRTPSTVLANTNLSLVDTIQYEFENLRINARGLGSYGFEKRTETDQVRNTRSVTFFHNDFYRRGLERSASKELRKNIISPWQALETSSNSYDVTYNGQGVDAPYLKTGDAYEVRMAERLTKTFDYFDASRQLGETTEQMIEYDASGNLLQAKKTVHDISTDTKWFRDTTNTYDARVSERQWQHLDLLKTATTVHTSTEQFDDGGDSGTITKRSEFEYTEKGQLKAEIVEPDAEIQGEGSGQRFREYLRTEYDYDPALGHITSKIDFGYNHVAQLEDRQSLVVTEYLQSDASSVLQWVRRDTTTNDVGHTTVAERNLNHGGVVYIKDENGLETTSTYDGFGKLLSSNRANGTQIEVTFNSWVESGDPYALSSAYSKHVRKDSGSPEVITYRDREGRVVRTVTEGYNAGKKIFTDTVYDTIGRKGRERPPYFQSDTPLERIYTYEQFTDRLKRIDHIDGTQTTFEYDGLSTTTIRDGRRHVEKRYATGEIYENSQGAVGDDTSLITLRHSYDGAGRLRETLQTELPEGSTTPRKIKWHKEYDARDRLVRERDPDTGLTQHAYNGFGDQVWRLDANNRRTNLSYDGIGRLLERSDPSGTMAYVYDTANHGLNSQGAFGLVDHVSYSNASGDLLHQMQYTYDQFSRVDNTVETHSAGSTYTHQVDFTYDGFSRLETTSVPGHPGVTRHYLNGQFYKLTRGDGSAVWEATTADVDSWGRIQSATLGNGLINTYEWTGPGRKLSDMKVLGDGEALIHHSYTYYPEHAGLRTRNDHYFDFTETVDYDELGRLDTVATQYQNLIDVETFDYDAFGNLLGRPDRPELAGLEFKYGPGKVPFPDGDENDGVYGVHALVQVGDRSLTYQDNGNLISDGERQYQWAAFDKPIAVRGRDAELTLTYGVDHRRIRRVATNVSTEVFQSTDYLSGGSDISVERVSGINGTVNRYYLNVAGQAVAVDGLEDETRRYLHHDQLGSVVALSDSPGSILERYSYDVWGARRTLDDLDPTFNLTLNSFEQSRGFTGHEMLDSVGLIHMNGRVYDPQLARFTSADPVISNVENAQFYNRYSYIQNNPVGGVDPSGYTAVLWQQWYDGYQAQQRRSRNRANLFTLVSFAVTGGVALELGGGIRAAIFANALNAAAVTAYSGGSGNEILRSAVRGAISAGVANAIGDLGGSGWVRTYKPLVHAGTQASIGYVFGDSDRQIIGAAFSAALAELTPDLGEVGPDVALAMMVGGLGSVATDGSGGSFFRGALTSGAVRLYNHGLHADDPGPRPGSQFVLVPDPEHFGKRIWVHIDSVYKIALYSERELGPGISEAGSGVVFVGFLGTNQTAGGTFSENEHGELSFCTVANDCGMLGLGAFAGYGTSTSISFSNPQSGTSREYSLFFYGGALKAGGVTAGLNGASTRGFFAGRGKGLAFGVQSCIVKTDC